MVQVLQKPVTFAEFADWKPDGEPYELHNGVIVEMSQPTGPHEDVIGLLIEELVTEYKRLKLSYSIPKQALVKPPKSESGYVPDILLLNKTNLVNEPLWQKQSTVTQAASIPLIVEVVSTNWRDDYLTKLRDYEEIGIPEYWIIDYLALGGIRYIGSPKQPTISIYLLIEGEYQVRQFRNDEKIISPTFPDLSLTAQQIFQAGNIGLNHGLDGLR
ncbi:Uma2 family endonuclease [Dolichospermum heterosporum]|uniref:Uma2 family endonuclease n=1 Tax=Dolichospermum heterosporum TAC447 TaxID=747523 RepID=A0ABY5LQJ2_9CYAN|nr:Uma2 family endonuclease [Dolichospermum heterosporum]UUO13074.1 Uma2 family endonuclease [Dolichospermum heterosporum TAC447]